MRSWFLYEKNVKTSGSEYGDNDNYDDNNNNMTMVIVIIDWFIKHQTTMFSGSVHKIQLVEYMNA